MNICLVLGAGSSLANAKHFRPERMRNTRPPLDVTFFQTVQARGIQLAPSLRSYLRTLLRSEPTADRISAMRMEEFFKDLFFDFQDAPSNTRLRSAYTELVDLYVRVLRETTNWLCDDGREGGPVGRLIADAAHVAEQVTVITFNHDLVIENEIFRRAHLRDRWCLDEGYGSFGTELHRLLPPSSQRPSLFPSHDEDVCDHSQPITVLKLHGSLNWIVRLNSVLPTARTLSGEAGTRDIHLLTARHVQPRTQIGRSRARGRGRGRSAWYTWPVIIPPVYAKQALRRRIQVVWQDARAAIEACDRIVFFGYSLPEIDIEAEKLFERAVALNNTLQWADVVNPSPDSARRYAALAPAIPVRWYPSPEQFRSAGTFA